MNQRQKELQQHYLNNEKAVLKQLERNYQDALDEINSKIELLMARQDADMQHVIYQVEYQKALKTQVQAILETLQANEFETVSEYLTQSYEDGFIGTMYDLQNQGIPLIFPIDQEQVAEAIQTETNLSESLYTAMGHDIKDLQKKISGEISRGLSSGQMYSEITRNIASWARIPKNNAMRITRTEAHRIQCRAGMNACQKAKSKGADVVKQWDASLDAKTRDSHARIDGEIKELDEKFSNGLMYPGDPAGSAAEVINCRCALLQRARWALGNDYTKWSPDAPVVVDDDGTTQFAVIEAKNYKDFQKKYKQATERVRGNAQKMNDVKGSNDVATNAIKEAYEYKRKKGLNLVPYDKIKGKHNIKADFKGMDSKLADATAKQFYKLTKKYNTLCESINVGKLDASGAPAGTIFAGNTQSAHITFNKGIVSDYAKFKERMKKAVENGQFFGMDASQYDNYVITHEFAHTLMDFGSPLKNVMNADTSYIRKARKEIHSIRQEYLEDIRASELKYRQAENKALETFEPADWENAQKLKADLDSKIISKYADMSIDEFMAEAFADAQIGSNPSEYSKRVLNVIDKYFKK